MKSHLRVKVFSMSSEMTYIRRQEEKWKNKARYARKRVTAMRTSQAELSVQYAEKNFRSLREHRKDMKHEARTTHLAYGFMRGRSYQQMENICYGVLKGYGSCEPYWSKIEAIVERFSKDEPSPQDFMQRYAEWLAEAKKWYEDNPERILEAIAARCSERQRLANDSEYQKLKKERSEAMKMANLGLYS